MAFEGIMFLIVAIAIGLFFGWLLFMLLLFTMAVVVYIFKAARGHRSNISS